MLGRKVGRASLDLGVGCWEWDSEVNLYRVCQVLYRWCWAVLVGFPRQFDAFPSLSYWLMSLQHIDLIDNLYIDLFFLYSWCFHAWTTPEWCCFAFLSFVLLVVFSFFVLVTWHRHEVAQGHTFHFVGTGVLCAPCFSFVTMEFNNTLIISMHTPKPMRRSHMEGGLLSREVIACVWQVY